MNKRAIERQQTTSCGGLAWRQVEGRVEVLLIKQFQHLDRWGIPKGHANPGEEHQACAMREIREEAGVEVRLTIPLPDAHVAYGNEDKTVKSWLAECIGSQEPRHNDPDSEVADARWFDVEALPIVHNYQRDLVTEAIRIIKGCIEHDRVVSWRATGPKVP